MTSQNPVFIPGRTHIPERLRQAVNTRNESATGVRSDVATAQECCRDTASARSEAA